MFFDAQQVTYWPYLLSSLLLASTVLVQVKLRQQLFGFFSISVFLHNSAIKDYKLFIINNILYLSLLLPLVFNYSLNLHLLLADLLPSYVSDDQFIASFKLDMLYSGYLFICYDFFYFNFHKLLHKDPMLWPFHRLHHDAQVLTPVTVFRVHPLETALKLVFISSLLLLADALFKHFCHYNVTVMSIAGANIFFWLFFISGYHLRHSHIKIYYPKYLSYILMSPVQHQFHHSQDKKLSNSNFGFALSLWDTVNNSLYIPKLETSLELPSEQRNFRQQLIEPFILAFNHHPLRLLILTIIMGSVIYFSFK